MRWILASALFGLFLALSAGTAPAQDRPIDLSSKGAKVFRGASGQGLTLPSQAAPRAVTVSFLRSQGHLPETIGSLVATGESRVARKGITHLRFAQEVEGLTVYGTYVRAAVNDRGELVHLIENLATPPAGGLVRTVIDEQVALEAALDEVHPGVFVTLAPGRRVGNTTGFSGDDFFHRDPKVTRVAIPMESGLLQEGYLVETWTEDDNLLHHTLVGGAGRILRVELRTNNDSYNIFPEHPDATPVQTIVPGPGISDTCGLPYPSPKGWLFSGSHNTVDVSGNNVHAYTDAANDNTVDGGGSSVTDGDFLTSADLTAQPNTVQNKAVAVQNLFYFNNVIHDKLYDHGFTEDWFNFQEDNCGNGGAEADSVYAEAQDGSGMNNANFATPADGTRPRMQMYLWGVIDPSVVMQTGPTYENVARAEFGPTPSVIGHTGEVVLVDDGVGTTSDGCEGLSQNLLGSIALVDRGNCDFVVKALNAQAAGAIAIIVVNNAGDGVVTLGDNGNGGSVDIPSVMVGQSDGNAIKAALPDIATVKSTELLKDGDLDSDIIYHEYGHGLTWRMIGGMSGSMSGAIGEGMSDVLAILMNDEDRVGEYSTEDPNGIRSRPYSGYSSYRTYGDFASSLGVHRNGEIYAAAVWRVWELFKADFIPLDTLFDYLIDGMTYTAPGPAMEDMRDGILQSAAGSGDECLIWQGFAELGIGDGAGYNANNGVVTESFDMPTECSGVAINTPPTASFTYSCNHATLICLFTDTSSDVDSGQNVDSWSWDFDDAATLEDNTSSLQDPSHTFSAPGDYTVSLAVTDNGDPEKGDSTSQTITVGAPAGSGSVRGTARNSSGVKLGGVMVMVDTHQIPDPSANTNNGGKYTIAAVDEGTDWPITATKAGYCLVGPHTVSVTPGVTTTLDIEMSSGACIPGTPIASFTFSCSGQTCDFTDTSTAGDTPPISLSWNFDDPTSPSNTSTLPNPSHTFTADGEYTVSLTITDSHSTPRQDSTSQNVTVGTPTGSGSVKGTTRSGGVKLGGVMVTVVTPQTPSATSNNGGKYTIATVDAGNWTVTATKTGYCMVGEPLTVSVSPGATTTQDIEMTPCLAPLR